MQQTASYTSTTLIDELTEERRRRLAVESAAVNLLQLLDMPLEHTPIESLRTCETVKRLRDVLERAGGR